jgi:hypothetical protein
MKPTEVFFTAIFAIVLMSCQQKPKQETATPTPKATINDFFGQWTIDVQGGGVSWL